MQLENTVFIVLLRCFYYIVSPLSSSSWGQLNKDWRNPSTLSLTDYHKTRTLVSFRSRLGLDSTSVKWLNLISLSCLRLDTRYNYLHPLKSFEVPSSWRHRLDSKRVKWLYLISLSLGMKHVVGYLGVQLFAWNLTYLSFDDGDVMSDDMKLEVS